MKSVSKLIATLGGGKPRSFRMVALKFFGDFLVLVRLICAAHTNNANTGVRMESLTGYKFWGRKILIILPTRNSGKEKIVIKNQYV